ncbi:MAG TPA: tetratricopeptide repeat protein [Fimbriimonas sp.]
MAQQPSSARLDAIWDAAMDRMTTQTDLWFEDGEFPKVIQVLKIQNQLYPGDYDVATDLGWMLGNIELYDQELATYLRYKSQNPNDPDRALPEAQFYFLKRAYPKVVEILEPIDKTKAHPNNWRILAQAYRRQNMFQDTKRVLEAYLKLHPDDEAAKANLRKAEEDLNKKSG